MTNYPDRDDADANVHDDHVHVSRRDANVYVASVRDRYESCVDVDAAVADDA